MLLLFSVLKFHIFVLILVLEFVLSKLIILLSAKRSKCLNEGDLASKKTSFFFDDFSEV